MDKLVIIPTYNERENIPSILQAVFELPGEFHVLVVDDGSPDQTAALVKELMTSYPGKLFLEERKRKIRFRYCLYPWFSLGDSKRVYVYF